MRSEDIAILAVLITAILTTGSVLILRPITRRLGGLLEVMTQHKLKLSNNDPYDLVRIRESLASIDGRLCTIEERQDFAEALISAGDTRMLSIQAAQHAQERN
ncbi:MAG TPA: hypothetical protein VEX86_24805 [Longimicrobium sp.]|nr:hypothetical protein [Longimicrobium sp.]